MICPLLQSLQESIKAGQLSPRSQRKRMRAGQVHFQIADICLKQTKNKNLEKVLTYLHEYDRIFVPLKGAYFLCPIEGG